MVKKYFLYCLMFLIVLELAAAQSITFEPNKLYFHQDEELRVNVTITNDLPEAATFTLNQYFIFPDQTSLPFSFPNTFDLAPNEVYTFNAVFTFKEDMPEGFYAYEIVLEGPTGTKSQKLEFELSLIELFVVPLEAEPEQTNWLYWFIPLVSVVILIIIIAALIIKKRKKPTPQPLYQNYYRK